MTIRLTVQTGLSPYGENAPLIVENQYGNVWDQNPYIHSNGDGTGYCDLSVAPGNLYYKLSKKDGSSFTILKAEVLQ